jgi:hypothetical protein
MHLGLNVSSRFFKAFGKAFLDITGIPGALIIVLYLLGLKIDPKVTDAFANYIQPYGPGILIVIVLGIAIDTTYRVIKKDREEYTKRFYEFNSLAAIERAYLVFSRLNRRAKVVENGVAEDRDNWDKEVQAALKTYCSSGTLQRYLIETQRFQPGTEFTPLTIEDYKCAVNFVESLLRNEFEPFDLKR